MPFMVPALAAIGGGSAVAGGLTLATTAGGLIAANQNNKKAEGAMGEAARASQVDIDSLDAKTRDMAQRNAREAAALEQLLTPEVSALRKASTEGVLKGLGEDSDVSAARKLLIQQIMGGPESSLLKSAAGRAQEELDMGGELPLDIRNLVTRRALAKSGAVSGGLGLGRDLSARDLGLTSLQLRQQRLQNAADIGQLDATGLINNLQLLRSMSDSNFGRNLSAAQFSQSIPQPVVGLDPSSVANLAVGNANNAGAAATNRANIYGQQQQGFTQLAGQGLGYGLLNFTRPKS